MKGKIERKNYHLAKRFFGGLESDELSQTEEQNTHKGMPLFATFKAGGDKLCASTNQYRTSRPQSPAPSLDRALNADVFNKRRVVADDDQRAAEIFQRGDHFRHARYSCHSNEKG
jgi:hypothetical protein